jgi:hypothetical protein
VNGSSKDWEITGRGKVRKVIRPISFSGVSHSFLESELVRLTVHHNSLQPNGEAFLRIL